MNFQTLVTDQGHATTPFGVRMTSAMTNVLGGDYKFAYPAERKFQPVKVLGMLMTSFIKWQAAREAANQLRALDNRLLMDIGVKRSDIDALAHGWK